MPKLMKAVVTRGTEARLERDRPVPKLRDDYILVKTHSVALNPTDWKHIAFGASADGCLVGCDFAGVVEEIGPAVTKQWKVGDRICGVAHGGNLCEPEDGAFAEYIVAKGDIQIKIPGNVTFEQAATLALGITTVGQGLYQQALKLRLPTEPYNAADRPNILIYGGSTATGALGIQFARLSGCSVFTTCSPANFEYTKGLGAIEAFDHNDAEAVQKLRARTARSGLKLAWDTIGTEESVRFCMGALANEPGCKYGHIAFPLAGTPREDVEAVGTLMYSVFGEAFEKGANKFPPNAEDFEFTKKFIDLTEKLLASGQLKPHTESVGHNGLEGVLEGLEMLKNGKVRGKKLVYVVADTP